MATTAFKYTPMVMKTVASTTMEINTGVEDGTIPDGFTFSTGYSPLHDRGIPISGQSPWVMLYQSNRTGDDLPEHHGNLAFVVRHYEAQLGSETVTTPHINVRHINNGAEQVSFELGVPFDENNKVIPAGSEIRATVEYLVPPHSRVHITA